MLASNRNDFDALLITTCKPFALSRHCHMHSEGFFCSSTLFWSILILEHTFRFFFFFVLVPILHRRFRCCAHLDFCFCFSFWYICISCVVRFVSALTNRFRYTILYIQRDCIRPNTCGHSMAVALPNIETTD